MTAVRIAHLYPRHMNLYGDRGNVLCLQNRCRWRGIDVTVTDVEVGDPLDPDAFDLIFVGGGPDREQQRVAGDLLGRKAAPLRTAVERGVVLLAVCGGYQLLGRYYRPGEGADLPGLGLLDLTTEHPGHQTARCIGNLTATWGDTTLVGFENHGGRTHLGPGCRPLAHVTKGFGNNGQDGTEGAMQGSVYGTYLHGSFLPKNPVFTDHLLAQALQHAGAAHGPLAPLDDTLELRANATAVRLASERLNTGLFGWRI